MPAGLILLVSLLLGTQVLRAQTTTWTGSTGTNWNTATNWSGGEVPVAADEVVIPGAPANQPVINTAAVARTITVQSGATLTVQAAGSLTLNGSAIQAIHNQGTVQNHGNIVIGNTAGVGQTGVRNDAVFHNNSGGTISIDQSTHYGLRNLGSIFTNAGKITIGGNAGAGNVGLFHENGTFTNDSDAEISVDRSNIYGLEQDGGTFTNAGKITMGANAGLGGYGLASDGVFNNNSSGEINIGYVNIGLWNFDQAFNNWGKINLGIINDLGLAGLRNTAPFYNHSGGEISINRTINAGLDNYNSQSTFINSGKITIGAINLLAGDAISNWGAGYFQNDACALIHIVSDNVISNSSSRGFANAGIIIENASGNSSITSNSGIVQNLNGGTFGIVDNTGSLITDPGTIWSGCTNTNWNTAANWLSNTVPVATDMVIIPGAPANQPVISATALARTVTVLSNATLTVQAAGSLTINNSPAQGILNQGTVQNHGNIVIGNTTNVGTYGIRNESVFHNNGGQIAIDRWSNTGLYNVGGTFTNAAQITIGAIASAGERGLWNTGVFNNNSGEITINRTTNTGLYHSAGTFTNASKITIGAIAGVGLYGVRSAAAFNNNAGGEIGVDRSTNTGLYNGSNTFNNAAKITIGANTGVGTYGLHNAAVFNNSGGEISIDRSSNTGLYNGGGTFTNTAKITIGVIDGVGSEGIRNNATFQNAACDAVINIVANAIVNNTGTFNNAGIIIENATGTSGITSNTGVVQNLNDGTFNVGSGNAPITTAGTIWMGCVDTDWSTAGNWHTGAVPTNTDHAIISPAANTPVIEGGWSAGSVHILAGGTLTIEAASSLAINSFFTHITITAGFRNQGMVSNYGLLILGGVASVGDRALWNQSVFTNHTGARISVDRGLLANTGDFTNDGEIAIGTIAPVGSWGLWNNGGSFTNNGRISIDNAVSRGLFNANGTFTNAGGITIGATAGVGSQGVRNEATFLNDPCAEIYQYAPLFNSNTFTNNGLMLISTDGPHDNTALTNSGIISYPKGNPVPDVTNNGIIIAPLTIDNCTTIRPVFSLGDTPDLTIEGIFTDVTAILPAGTYNATTNTFTADPKLDEGVYDLFVKISDPVGMCTRIVPWQLTTQDCSLPVTLVSFDVKAEGSAIHLRWATSSELNASHFEVQRSADGHRFEAIGRVEARSVVGGDTNHGVESYFFADWIDNGQSTTDSALSTFNRSRFQLSTLNSQLSIIYYRLKMVDHDGTYEFSPIRSVHFESMGTILSVYPNPVADRLHIRASHSQPQKHYDVRLFNAAGARVYSAESTLPGSIDVANFPPGLYYLQVAEPGGREKTRAIIIGR